jgi:predicted phosphodiesterase
MTSRRALKSGTKKSVPHRIAGQRRPTGMHPSHQQSSHGNQKFQSLPNPTGPAPYRLSLDEVLPSNIMSEITKNKTMAFHVVGDTGGIKDPNPQQAVADAMDANFTEDNLDVKPSFFYHLGDVVYFTGQDSEYYSQFYEPYQFYSNFIFAIPGNHDGEVDPNDNTPSLEGFVRNFCARQAETSPDALNVPRHTMTQPNVYWTLNTPYATIIGLYSNVVEGGEFDQDQKDWFINELKSAPKTKAVIVCLHHPPYSMDGFKGGSKNMEQELDDAFDKSGRVADIVMAGHVHNYQRFTRDFNGKQIPYIVAGAGGYHNLHHIRKQSDGSSIQVPFQTQDNDVILENYCTDHFGYMVLTVTDDMLSGDYYIVPKPIDSWSTKTQKIDSFELDLKKHVLTRNTNPPQIV